MFDKNFENVPTPFKINVYVLKPIKTTVKKNFYYKIYLKKKMLYLLG